MTAFLTHRTTDGDRWDRLALAYYGDPLHLGPVLRANPGLAALAVLPPNETVRVPVIERTDLAPDEPPPVPWR